MTAPLPLNVIIMAGGQGQRLRPLTNDTPKPLLAVGGRPIIEHLVQHLVANGVQEITVSVGYLGQKIKDFLQQGDRWQLKINYLDETVPLGSIGIVNQNQSWKYDDFLVINGDLMTNFNLYRFYQQFVDLEADMAVATYEYQLEIPWGILKVDTTQSIVEIREKPVISRFINAGIYLFRRRLLALFPPQARYEGWQLLKDAIAQQYAVKAIPIEGYWMDIGNLNDFEKAQKMMWGGLDTAF